jgi:hypothetical protein
MFMVALFAIANSKRKSRIIGGRNEEAKCGNYIQWDIIQLQERKEILIYSTA